MLADTANQAGHIGALVSYYAPMALAAVCPFAKQIFNYATADIQKLMAEQNQLLNQLLAERPPK